MTNDIRIPPVPDLADARELARQGFTRDLPQLLNNHFGCWVAYHGPRQVGIARHSGELHELCRQQHLPPDEILLFEIVPPDEEIVFGPMAFD